MKRCVWLGCVPAAALLATLFSPQPTQAQSAPVTVKWHANAVVKLTLTPNYYSAFGAQLAKTFGTPPPIQHGPDATGVGAGAVDFGPVLAGQQYIYRYATHLNVTTNDGAGFYVYGEGAANFYNQGDGSSQPLDTTLYYLKSTSGSPADTNGGFSSGLPFQATTGAVSPSQPNFGTAPSITYGTYPATPVANSTTAVSDLYYDYLLKVPPAATSGAYFVWVVYTVVAK